MIRLRSDTPRAYGWVMSLLTLLFFLRVAGQALVAFLDASFLPPMTEWYSGLISYPILFPIQCVLLGGMIKIDADLLTGRGFFAGSWAKFGKFLIVFSALYFGAMVLRYGVTMAFHPERRWLGGTIPIFFHFVLAGYIFVWGCFQTRVDA